MQERSRLSTRTVSTERKQIGRKCGESGGPSTGLRAGSGPGELASSREGWLGGQGSPEAWADSGMRFRHSPEGRRGAAAGCVKPPPLVGQREAPQPAQLAFVPLKGLCVRWDLGGQCERDLRPWLRVRPSLPLPARGDSLQVPLPFP